WHYRALARSVPPIDDITTDTDNPPAFIAVIKLREAEDGNSSTYAGAETAALQKRGYPDLAPLSLALAPEKAFPIALATAKKMSWTIVEVDPTTRRIEASEQSFWMGLTDDIVVRVADAEADPGSRIDVRSASRHGRSDLGVNAARIRTYLAALHEAEKPVNKRGTEGSNPSLSGGESSSRAFAREGRRFESRSLRSRVIQTRSSRPGVPVRD